MKITACIKKVHQKTFARITFPVQIPEITEQFHRTNGEVSLISSAEAEQGFSILAQARTKSRSRLTQIHMDDFLRIRCNGGQTLDLSDDIEDEEELED